MEYNKSPKSIDEQLRILTDRGLIINDLDKAGKYLKHISYYHLSAYFKSFQGADNQFNDETTFEDVLNVYRFDKKLRLLLLEHLEVVEKSFKCKLIYKISTENNNAHWLTDVNLFYNAEQHSSIILPLLKKIKLSKDESIRHYYEKYTSPEYPPAWTSVDCLSFGETVRVFRWLITENRNLVSREYGLDEKIFLSWMFGLTFVRNVCAHNSRLWNKSMVIEIKQNLKLYSHLFNSEKENYLYNYLVVLLIILSKMSTSVDLISKLEDIINIHKIDVSRMGFPGDWVERLDSIK